MNNLRIAFRILPKLRTIAYKYYNRLWFRLVGVECGRNMNVYDKVYLLGQGRVRIGDDFTFLSGDSLNPICRNIRGAIYVPFKQSSIIIGNRVGMSSVCLHAMRQIIIGNDVKIGADVLIIDNDSHPIDFTLRRDDNEYEKGSEQYLDSVHALPVTIDDDVWIGARSIILKGVHIGARSIIAAGSVVTRNIPPDSIAGGNPAKVLRQLSYPG